MAAAVSRRSLAGQRLELCGSVAQAPAAEMPVVVPWILVSGPEPPGSPSRPAPARAHQRPGAAASTVDHVICRGPSSAPYAADAGGWDQGLTCGGVEAQHFAGRVRPARVCRRPRNQDGSVPGLARYRPPARFPLPSACSRPQCHRICTAALTMTDPGGPQRGCRAPTVNPGTRRPAKAPYLHMGERGARTCQRAEPVRVRQPSCARGVAMVADLVLLRLGGGYISTPRTFRQSTETKERGAEAALSRLENRVPRSR